MARASAAALLLASVAILWRLAARGGSGQSGACGAAFLRSGGGPARPPAEAAPWPVRSLSRETAGLALALAACGAAYGLHHGWRAKTPVSLRRPYVIPDLHRTLGADLPRDPSAELSRIFGFIQDVVLRPLNDRLPGRPFEYDFHSFPFTPMVLVIGNHSSGKSTFINNLLGKSVQDTGVAPTDDCFTVLERHEREHQEDGPTVMGCPENRPFAELRRFGQLFAGHLRRKRVVLPGDSRMPFGLQIVDTPGMIDLPASDSSFGGRGYNFVDVARWWAKRSDLILLLFDPDKPGTTGETLEVLTESLQGLDHKFMIVLNKSDKLDSSADFARAYGALGWSLSKVIKWKDIPTLFTVFNEGFGGGACAAGSGLPLEAFSQKREELIDEVLRVRERHNDNIVTALDETLCQVEMVCTVVEAVRARVCARRRLLVAAGTTALAALALGAAQLRTSPFVELLAPGARLGLLASCLAPCLGGALLLRGLCAQHQRLLRAGLGVVLRECYAQHFVHRDGEDVEYRWQAVAPKVYAILDSVQSLAHLPRFRRWELARIQECLEKDIWYLRQIARQLRSRSGEAGRWQRAGPGRELGRPQTESLDRAGGGEPPRAEAARGRAEAPLGQPEGRAEGGAAAEAPRAREEAERLAAEEARGAQESPDRAAGDGPTREGAAGVEAPQQGEGTLQRLWEDAEKESPDRAAGDGPPRENAAGLRAAAEAAEAFRQLRENAERARREAAQESPDRAAGEGPSRDQAAGSAASEEALQRLREDAQKVHAERTAAEEARNAQEVAGRRAAEEARRAQEACAAEERNEGRDSNEARGTQAEAERRAAEEARSAVRQAAEEARRAREDFERLVSRGAAGAPEGGCGRGF